MSGLTFDAGGLIALERDDRRLKLIVESALEDDRIEVPATALAQVMRIPARQARLMRLLRDGRVFVVPLDLPRARAVGLLLAESRTSDVVDAHVVVCAREAGFTVVTSDPSDLRRLDPSLRLIAV